LKAARAHGMPMIVMAMTTAAMTQPAAIQNPPKRIQSRLSRNERGDMDGLPELRRRGAPRPLVRSGSPAFCLYTNTAWTAAIIISLALHLNVEQVDCCRVRVSVVCV